MALRATILRGIERRDLSITAVYEGLSRLPGSPFCTGRHTAWSPWEDTAVTADFPETVPRQRGASGSETRMRRHRWIAASMIGMKKHKDFPEPIPVVTAKL